MTLIIAISCTDGVVMAADSAATFGVLGQRTIRQPTKKLAIVNGCMIVGVSGPIGMQQRFIGELEANTIGGKRHNVMSTLSGILRKHIEPEFKMAQVTQPTIGQQLALNSAITSTVVGLLIGGVPTLIQFDQQGSPECATDNLRFVSIGSGQQLADPFLAFIARIFWSSKLPAVSDGLFAATWVLTHAIHTNPGGVDGPIQAMTLKCGPKNQPEIHELDEADLQEHKVSIEAAERRLATFRDAIATQSGADSEIPTAKPS